MATDTRHERLWHELNDLHEQEKISECIKHGRTNLFDPRMPLYWRVKTLCTLVVAEDLESGWAKADWWRNFAEDVYRDFEKDQGADPTRLRSLRASLDLLREYQALGAPSYSKIMRAGMNSMEAAAAEQDARDAAARDEAAKVEATKGQAATNEATKKDDAKEVAENQAAGDEAAENEAAVQEAAKTASFIGKQNSVKNTEDVRSSERAIPELAGEPAFDIMGTIPSTANFKRKRWNYTSRPPDVTAGDLLGANVQADPPSLCDQRPISSNRDARNEDGPRSAQTALDTPLLGAHSDNQALDPLRGQRNQSSHIDQESGERNATTHHDDTRTVQTLKELELQQATSRQQRDLFMDGFVQRERQMSLAIDEWEVEASLRARQAQEATRQSQVQAAMSAESTLRMKEVTGRMVQSRKEHDLCMEEIAERKGRSCEEHARPLAEPLQDQEKTQVPYEEYLQEATKRAAEGLKIQEALFVAWKKELQAMMGE